MKFFIICAVFLVSRAKADDISASYPWNAILKFNCQHFVDVPSDTTEVIILKPGECDINQVCNTLSTHPDVRVIDASYFGASVHNSAFNTLIECLPSTIERLKLSGSFIGKPNATAFGKLKNLHWLELQNTSLIISDSNPFEPLENLRTLDISYNDQKNIDFAVLSTTLIRLNKLSVTHCHIQNASLVTEHLGASMKTLELCGNPIGHLNANTFKNLSNLENIYLSNVSISSLDTDTFKYQPLISRFDVSHNNLKELDFQLVPRRLEFFEADGNNLQEIRNFDEDSFPLIQAISIAGNQFSCDYLVKLMSDWPKLLFLSNPAIQKHDDDCESKFKAIKKSK